jgi:hypothetical protein
MLVVEVERERGRILCKILAEAEERVLIETECVPCAARVEKQLSYEHNTTEMQRSGG